MVSERETKSHTDKQGMKKVTLGQLDKLWRQNNNIYIYIAEMKRETTPKILNMQYMDAQIHR